MMRLTTRFTTQLLPTIHLSRDPRRRWATGVIVAGLVLFAVGVSWRPRPEPALTPRISQERMGYIIITATAAAATWTPQPTSAPVIVFATVEVDRPVYVQVENAPAQDVQPAQVAPTETPDALDQADPRCTGAADGTIAAGCGLTDAQRREAEQH